VAEAEKEGVAKRSFYLLLLVVVLSLMATMRSYLKEEPEWGRFAAAEDGFSVLVAGSPDRRTMEEDLPSGKVESHYLTFARGGVQYAVARVELPAGGQGEGRAVLERAGAALVERVQGELLEEREISASGFAGRRLEIEAGDGSVLQARIILANDRLYTLMAGMGEEREELQTEVDSFFASFEILTGEGEAEGSPAAQ
jgi:hypothetical protein